MKDCVEEQWRSKALVEGVKPGAKVVLDIGDDRLALEVVGIVGDEACLWMWIETPVPREA